MIRKYLEEVDQKLGRNDPVNASELHDVAVDLYEKLVEEREKAEKSRNVMFELIQDAREHSEARQIAESEAAKWQSQAMATANFVSSRTAETVEPLSTSAVAVGASVWQGDEVSDPGAFVLRVEGRGYALYVTLTEKKACVMVGQVLEACPHVRARLFGQAELAPQLPDEGQVGQLVLILAKGDHRILLNGEEFESDPPYSPRRLDQWLEETREIAKREGTKVVRWPADDDGSPRYTDGPVRIADVIVTEQW